MILIGVNSLFSPFELKTESFIADSSSLNLIIEFLSSENVTLLFIEVLLFFFSIDVFKLLFAFSNAFLFISSKIASSSDSEFSIFLSSKLFLFFSSDIFKLFSEFSCDLFILFSSDVLFSKFCSSIFLSSSFSSSSFSNSSFSFISFILLLL